MCADIEVLYLEEAGEVEKKRLVEKNQYDRLISLMQENSSCRSSRLLADGEEDKSEVLPLGEGQGINETTGTMMS